MTLTTCSIPTLPNHFKIKIRKPVLINHIHSLEVEVLSINDFYSMIRTVAELRIMETINQQYICAIADQYRCAFCIGKDEYDEVVDTEVITLYSVLPKMNE